MASSQIVRSSAILRQQRLPSTHSPTASQELTAFSISPQGTRRLAPSAHISQQPDSLRLCHLPPARQHSVACGIKGQAMGKSRTSWRPATAFTFLLPKDSPLQAHSCARRLGRRQARNQHLQICRASFSWRDSGDPEEEECDEDGICTPAGMKAFDDGRQLFNQREFYKCHDVLEELWHVSPEPQRTVLHGILQCAVGLYHLQNQNHRGALIQFGEGINKLRRQQLRDGPLFAFQEGMAELLEFVYNTQLEHAACDEEACVPMTGDDESYRLLGNFGAGQPMYTIQEGRDGFTYLYFNSARQEMLESQGFDQQRVVLPVLEVSEADLLDLSNR